MATYIYNLSTYWALRFGGPPRLDLRLFNSSACQKHQCTLCSPIVLSFSLHALCLFYLLLSFSHFSFLSLPPLSPPLVLPFALFLFSLAHPIDAYGPPFSPSFFTLALFGLSVSRSFSPPRSRRPRQLPSGQND